MRNLSLLLLAAVCAACPPSPRGHCSTDADCAGGPPGLFCADGVCQAPPSFHATVPRDVGGRGDTLSVRVQVDHSHGGADAARARIETAGTALAGVRDGAGSLRIDVPLSLAAAGTEGTLPVHLVVTDDTGHETALDDGLLYDDAPPALALVPDSSWHARSDTQVRATVHDLTLVDSTVVLAIGGATVQGVVVNGDLRSFAVPPAALPAGAEGAVPFTLTAADKFGHSTTVSGQVLVDDKPPVLATVASTVPSSAVLRNTTVALRVTADDASPVQVSFSLPGKPSQPARAIDSRTYELLVDTSMVGVSLDSTTVTITARDQGGNQTTIMVPIAITRLKWRIAPSVASPRGIILVGSQVSIANSTSQLIRVDRETSGTTIIPLNAPATGIVADDSFSYVQQSDSGVCKVGTGVKWCCGPFPILTSKIAVGPLPTADALGLTSTIVAVTTGDTSTGKRIYAIREKGPTTCEFFPSFPIKPFDTTTPVFAFDGAVFIAAPEFIVGATFDGLAWSDAPVSYPNKNYKGDLALGQNVGLSIPVFFPTGDGLLENITFQSNPPDPHHLPYGATVNFSTKATSGTTGVTGPTIAADGTLMVGSEDHHVIALTPAGSVKWSVPVSGALLGAPTQGEGNIAYAADGGGKLSALNVADGSVRWTYTVPAPLKIPPVLGCDGTLYLAADDGSIYALVSDSRGLADSPWPRVGRDNRGTGDARRKLRDGSGACLE